MSFSGELEGHGLKSRLYKTELIQKMSSIRRFHMSYAEPHLTLQEAKLRFESGQNVIVTREGDSFGEQETFSTIWFEIRFDLPPIFEGKEVHLLWDSGSEALVFLDDVPQQGMNGTQDADRRDFLSITSSCIPKKDCVAYVEMACSGMFGTSIWKIGPTAPQVLSYKLKMCCLKVFDREMYDLYWDYKIIADLAKHCPKDSSVRNRALSLANSFANMLSHDQCDPEILAQVRVMYTDFMREYPKDHGFAVYANGHCHIDTAWLWPYKETWRKCGRSICNALSLMRQFPEYVYVCSQAVQYQMVKEKYPEIWDELKQRVAEGRFIPVGGSWVEMDCNIPSGESFVRQFLYGQRFFLEEFGISSRIAFVPDTFGYASCLPGLMKKAGCSYFVTQKLSWNQVNKFPHSTFFWEGLDGTKVLTHFPTSDTYCSQANVEHFRASETNCKSLDRSQSALMLYGHGDGGGGPTHDMLEQLKRISVGIEGIPLVKNTHPEKFFQELEAKHSHELVTWVGELYFEYHRGTYTTQAKNKAYNRRCELLMRDIEFAQALELISSNCTDHMESTEALWKIVLLNQFHDVIPGTSIHQVYEDSGEMYCDVLQKGGQMLQNALHRQFRGVSSGGDARPAILNTCGFARREVVKVDGVSYFADVPAFGVIPLQPLPADRTVELIEHANGHFTLQNNFLRATLNQHGEVSSLVLLKEQEREYISEEVGTHFVLLEDIPNYWDAWDTEVYANETAVSLSKHLLITSHHVSSAEVSVTVEGYFGNSNIKQVISLSPMSEILRFDNTVEWNETRRFLKYEFPFNLRAHEATYEVPFGLERRPTHSNTSWDAARFEVCGHRFADISESNWGISLLNDCKFGHACKGSVMRLSLLRSPLHPDPTADRGVQTFAFALYPHEGPMHHATVQAGIAFNSPPLLVRGEVESDASFLTLSGYALQGVIVDTVKVAEDDLECLIVRVYEALGGSGTFGVTIRGYDLHSEVNLLENHVRSLSGESHIKIHPFEVMTLKFIRR